MERLLTSLHSLLDPELDRAEERPKPFFPLRLYKVFYITRRAWELSDLHERSPPIIHRDMSSRNVLLSAGMVAKIADLDAARIVPHMRAAATMTKAHGASLQRLWRYGMSISYLLPPSAAWLIRTPPPPKSCLRHCQHSIEILFTDNMTTHYLTLSTVFSIVFVFSSPFHM